MNKEISIGVGVGQIKFGFSEQELRNVIGAPVNIDVHEYGDELTKEYNYPNHDISFSFSSEDNYLLTSIDMYSHNYIINGNSIVNLSLNDALRIYEEEGFETPTIDCISNEVVKNHLMLYYNNEGLILSFIDYVCDSFSLGPHWKSETEISWPK